MKDLDCFDSCSECHVVEPCRYQPIKEVVVRLGIEYQTTDVIFSSDETMVQVCLRESSLGENDLYFLAQLMEGTTWRLKPTIAGFRILIYIPEVEEEEGDTNMDQYLVIEKGYTSRVLATFDGPDNKDAVAFAKNYMAKEAEFYGVSTSTSLTDLRRRITIRNDVLDLTLVVERY